MQMRIGSWTTLQRLAMVGAAVAVALNLVAFPIIEASSSDQRERALSAGHSARLMDHALQYPQTRARFDLYTALGGFGPLPFTLAPSAHEHRFVHVAYLHYLAQPVSVDVHDWEPTVDVPQWAEFVVAAGPGGLGGPPWFIAADPSVPADGWVILHVEDTGNAHGYVVWVVAAAVVGEAP